MPIDFNRQIIEEFRANGGRVGGPFEGGRLLLLTTVGARSGAPHTTPLGYLPDSGGRVLVIASAAGAPKHPAWFHNLVAHPRVTVEAGAFTYEAQAIVLEGAERDRAFARAAETDPGWSSTRPKRIAFFRWWPWRKSPPVRRISGPTRRAPRSRPCTTDSGGNSPSSARK